MIWLVCLRDNAIASTRCSSAATRVPRSPPLVDTLTVVLRRERSPLPSLGRALLVRAAPHRDSLGFFKQSDQLLERPNVIGDARSHARRRSLEGLVGAAEV